MKVKDFIEKLKLFDENYEVYFKDMKSEMVGEGYSLNVIAFNPDTEEKVLDILGIDYE